MKSYLGGLRAGHDAWVDTGGLDTFDASGSGTGYRVTCRSDALYADQLENFFGASETITRSLRDVFYFPEEAMEANGDVAHCSHHARPSPGTYLRAVFVEGDVSDPMEAILNSPVPSIQCQEAFWAGVDGG